MINFDFLEKGLVIVSPPHFAFGFSKKYFLISINWPNFIFWLSLLLEILGNMCIAIVRFLTCDVIYFELNHIFLILSFSYMTKKSRQTFKQASWERKKQSSSFLKGFQLLKTVWNLRVCLWSNWSFSKSIA